MVILRFNICKSSFELPESEECSEFFLDFCFDLLKESVLLWKLSLDLKTIEKYEFNNELNNKSTFFKVNITVQTLNILKEETFALKLYCCQVFVSSKF